MALQFDTTGSSADIFNGTVGQILAGLDQNASQNAQRQSEGLAQIEQGSVEINNLMLNMPLGRDVDMGVVPEPQYSDEDETDYNAPVSSQPATQAATQGKESIKLANYGYASDTSPDYNSNVLKIGNRNNPLEDGVSAALTKSLANRFGLKNGDWFEAVSADGTTYKRRYDDTVPTTYRGKPLPETIDLYNLKGSNNFGGRITSLRKL